MKLPKFTMPVLVKTRESGKKEFIGMTGREWAATTSGLCALYAVLAGFFTVLLVIAQSIRNSGDTFTRPGSDMLEDNDEP